MASYLRPRRGKKATAESQAIVLKKGEVFFEVPTTGVGTGAGKIKMGDGVTAYSSLPYFTEEIPKVEDAVIGFTDSNTETAASNNSTYLTNIKPANSLKTIFTNLKQLLYNYNAEITQLNNDLVHLTYYKFTINMDAEANTTYYTEPSYIDYGIDRNKVISSFYYFSNSLNDIPVQSFCYYYGDTTSIYRIQHRWDVAQRVTLVILGMVVNHF